MFVANEQSTLVKRLRAGHCARETCPASHYRLLFYDTPQINWSTLLAKAVPKPCRSLSPRLDPDPAPVLKPAPARWIPSLRLAKIAGCHARLSPGVDVVAMAYRRLGEFCCCANPNILKSRPAKWINPIIDRWASGTGVSPVRTKPPQPPT